MTWLHPSAEQQEVKSQYLFTYLLFNEGEAERQTAGVESTRDGGGVEVHPLLHQSDNIEGALQQTDQVLYVCLPPSPSRLLHNRRKVNVFGGSLKNSYCSSASRLLIYGKMLLSDVFFVILLPSFHER